VDLNSNLLALTASRARALCAAELSSEASVSLYGDGAMHDRFVARAEHGIRLLRELGVPVDVDCALGTHNTTQFAQLANLCEALGCASLRLFPCCRRSWTGGPRRNCGRVWLRCARHARCRCAPSAWLRRVPDECVMEEAITGITGGVAAQAVLAGRGTRRRRVRPASGGARRGARKVAG
jgi:hypothetical protein